MWLLLACTTGAPSPADSTGHQEASATDGCNGADDDGDGAVDEDPDRLWWTDGDGDGFGIGDPVAACAPPTASAPASGDCNDADPATFPGNDESCDGRDNDCDGAIDDGLAASTPAWADQDRDGSGDPDAPTDTCGLYPGWVDNALDCDDRDPTAPVFVSQSGADGATGRVEAPLVRIAEALGRAPACVWVDDGAWIEDLDLGTVEVQLRSRHGSAATTLLGAGGSSVITVAGGQTLATTIEGFAIVGGQGHAYGFDSVWNDGVRDYALHQSERRGGGVLIDAGAGASLREVVFTANVLPLYETTYTGASTQTDVDVRFGLGGGLYLNSGTADLTDVSFVDNEAAYGGGIGVAGGVTLTGRRLRFLGNTSNVGPAIMSNRGDVDLSNVLVDGTDALWDAGGIYLYGVDGEAGALRLVNATVVDTEAAIITEGNGSVELVNTLVVGNDWGLYDVGAATGTPATWRVSWTNLYANTSADAVGVGFTPGQDGNVSSSPLFEALSTDKDPDNDDLRLGVGSPARDAGDPDREDPDGSRSDMGAYGGPEAWP